MPRKAQEEDEGPSKAWMESYADAMTLLMAFFVMLYAFALVDSEKFFDFKVGMVQALGISNPINDDPSGMLFSGDGIAEVPGVLAIPNEEVRELIAEAEGQLDGEITPGQAEELQETLRQALEQLGVSDHVSVSVDERGVTIRFDDTVLFPSGSDRLSGDGSIILSQVAAVLGIVDNGVSVEGHTDSIPTSGSTWPTNWELSTARATTVVRHLIEVDQLPAARLSATGHADTRPRASNADEAGRRQNRRVEVVVLIDPLASAPQTVPQAGAEPAPSIDPGIDTGIDDPVLG